MHTDFAETQRQVRLACAPEPGDKRATLRTCIDCSAAFWDWTEKWRHRCADCSAGRAREQRQAEAARAARRRYR